MRSSVLATIALTTGFIALLYSACGKSNAKLAGSPEMKQTAITEFQKMELEFNAMGAIHKQLVAEHSGEIGSGSDSAHLQMEQQHLSFFEGFQDVIAKHKLFVLNSSAVEDSTELKTRISGIQADTRNMKDAMAKIKTDHTAMLGAHQQH
jgi:cytochrome c556